MRLDCRDRHVQLGGNLAIHLSLSDQHRNTALGRRQLAVAPRTRVGSSELLSGPFEPELAPSRSKIDAAAARASPARRRLPRRLRACPANTSARAWSSESPCKSALVVACQGAKSDPRHTYATQPAAADNEGFRGSTTRGARDLAYRRSTSASPPCPLGSRPRLRDDRRRRAVRRDEGGLVARSRSSGRTAVRV
jgi:hypothetical protein